VKSEYINPFMDATVNVIKTMAMLEPVPGKPYLKKGQKAVGDISGIIGLTGAEKGSVVISFSTPAICAVVGGMLGETYTDLVDDVRDAVGELTNMISGDARRKLAEIGVTFEAGLPSIIVGENHEIEAMTKGPVIVMPFTLDGNTFVVEASFEG